jgi:aspartate/methionine/tyrosine aminotransferase
LKVSVEHDIINISPLPFLGIDDPYYHLYYGDAPRPPSYFALEVDEPEVGRVVRFDSLSKVLSAGIRVGFVSGPERILEVVDLHVCTHPSHLIMKVLDASTLDPNPEPADLRPDAGDDLGITKELGV